MRRQADAALGRRQAELMAHRPRQERIDARSPRPYAFLQARQNEAPGTHEPGFENAEDRDARVAWGAAAHRLSGEEAIEQLREAGGRGVGKPVAFMDQRRDQPGGGLARRTGPQGPDITRAIGGQRLHRLLAKRGCGGVLARRRRPHRGRRRSME